MTTSRTFTDDEGTFGLWIPCGERPCPQCHARLVRVRVWESTDGAHEDQQFKCFALTCSHTWWVDGDDG